MGDKGKKVMDVGPSELPQDLPDGYHYKLTWQYPKDKKIVLLKVTDQGNLGTCWTIAFNRMIAAHLFIHDKAGSLLEFSSLHLYGSIQEKHSTGHLKSYEGLKRYLKEVGMILEDDCKCTTHKGSAAAITDACHKVKGRDVFKIRELVTVEDKKKIDEKQIIELLKTRGPIVVHIKLSRKYNPTKETDIYFGTTVGQENHMVLLTEYNTSPDGVNYFGFQNTWGQKWGLNGFGKFARKSSLPAGKPSLILAYMWPELLAQVFN